MSLDETWLQLMCCAYSDILSLYFGQADGLRFGWREGRGSIRATSTAHPAGPAGMPKGGDTALHPAIPGPERGL